MFASISLAMKRYLLLLAVVGCAIAEEALEEKTVVAEDTDVAVRLDREDLGHGVPGRTWVMGYQGGGSQVHTASSVFCHFTLITQ